MEEEKKQYHREYNKQYYQIQKLAKQDSTKLQSFFKKTTKPTGILLKRTKIENNLQNNESKAQAFREMLLKSKDSI